ncbi:DUF2752 domain-containing protein [Streptomyces millisiae]|uniref:DUF2752 domain-containing protein n=1 Tax=Streptomyces millisiae TaxID=3075542 RepID=A0ABU2LTF8_9ACTN|nr:DUF2752 domain-containing protein [Streptomyces sp. DSM 44918]MDT0320821.1 DUF2752 domain-containing protein [Streptomyces sp. DSM 44918]
MPPPRPPLAGRLSRLSWAAGAAAALGAVAVLDPAAPGRYPPCPVPALTGLHCPGCGGLRCVSALADADLGAALGANALAVAILAALLSFLALRLALAPFGRPLPAPAPRTVAWALGGAALVFTVLRNLPIGAALAP